MKYYDDESSQIVQRWGKGYFLVMSLTDNDFTGLTSVKVGLNPSVSSGLVEIINDPDKNGVFKVTNKDTQKFIVESTDGTNKKVQEYRLNNLTLS